MRITKIERQKKSADRVSIYVDGEFHCGLAADIAYDAGLSTGMNVDAATLERLEGEDVRWKAREAAYRLLGYRQRSEHELRRRLFRKDYPEHVVESVLAELEEKGLVDDEEFAAAFVRDRLRLKPRGVRRLVSELRSKGVDRHLAERVAKETLAAEGVTERELARRLGDEWGRRNLSSADEREGLEGDELWAARRRLYGYLGRRGFGGELAYEVVDEVIPEAELV